MAWNEPGGNGDKDPWGNRGDQGPPDLDEAIRKLQSQLTGIFGGGKGGGTTAGGGGLSSSSLILGLVVLLIVYVFWGVYQVDQQERAVVFRFGAVSEDVRTPGLHWNPLNRRRSRHRWPRPVRPVAWAGKMRKQL